MAFMGSDHKYEDTEGYKKNEWTGVRQWDVKLWMTLRKQNRTAMCCFLKNGYLLFLREEEVLKETEKYHFT